MMMMTMTMTMTMMIDWTADHDGSATRYRPAVAAFVGQNQPRRKSRHHDPFGEIPCANACLWIWDSGLRLQTEASA